MRYLFGFICVLALAVMGCGQDLGPVGGSGGDGGTGGTAGVGGSAGDGGSGGGDPPGIGFVMWQWLDDPCDANASGQSLIVIVAALDYDTPGDQLTYSGHVQDCTPDLNASSTTLSCDVYVGARQGEATVTDPEGNQDTMLFAPDPCTDDCVGSCP